MKIEIKNADSTLKKLLTALQKEKERVLENKVANMVAELKDSTPVDTGFARDNWKYSVSYKGLKIENDAPYIELLNHGSSKQAPEFFVERILLKYGRPIGQIVKINPS